MAHGPYKACEIIRSSLAKATTTRTKIPSIYSKLIFKFIILHGLNNGIHIQMAPGRGKVPYPALKGG